MKTVHRPARRTRPRPVALGLAVLALAAVGACTSSDEPAAVTTPSSAVVQPGKPGEAAETIAPEDFSSAVARAPHNEADAEFVTMMIEHHAQAVEMSSLVPDRADSEQVVTFARRMHVTQESEIRMMSTWLEEHDLPVPAAGQATGGDGEGPRAPSAHEHTDMPGMLSAAEVAELEDSTGAAFDRRFLQGMIRHHEGAVVMCRQVLSEGSDERVTEIATEVAVDQTAEIRRMKQLLDGL